MHKDCNQCGKSMWINNIKKHYQRKHPEHWDEDKKLYLVCVHCKEYFETGLSGHVSFCLLNPNREERIKQVLKNKVTFHTEESKNKISEGRKKWLKENPDKHPWKKNTKFKSQPCEYLKNKLTESNITFIPEYQPSEDRFFSIDIAFPSLKLGIEINGRQHYDKDYNLKDYYKERQNYLEEMGWSIVNIYYSKAFNKETLEDIKNLLIKNDYSKSEIENDFEYYRNILIEKDKQKICKCAGRKDTTAKECRKCSQVSRRSFTEQQINDMLELVQAKGFVQSAKQLGISDNGLRKRMLTYGIDPKSIGPYRHSKHS